MASGLPLVAQNSGDVKSYADDSNAWLADADGPSFAEAVRLIGSDEARRLRRIKAARITTERHGWERVADTFLKYYDELYAFTKKSKLTVETEPLFFSTPGDLFGRERRGAAQAKRTPIKTFGG